MIKEERQKTKQKKFRRRAILVAALIGVVMGILGIQVFVVREVEVVGNELYEEDLIEATVLNDDFSWSSLYVFFKYKLMKTKEVPFVDTMEVTMENPQKIKITVYEKGMLGYLFIPGINENAYFDKDGFVVETSSRIIPDVPKINGISCDEVVLYEKLPVNSSKLREILTLTQTLKRHQLIPETITYGQANEPILGYKKVSVQIGNISNLTQKVERLDRILPELKGKKGILHMENWNEDSKNIIFDIEK